jgi:tRNA(Ile2) C34 agmatinyltransferase TiaS
MVMRKCPKCDQKWYSSAAEVDWKCDKCGAIISKESNQNAEYERKRDCVCDH